MNRVQEKGNFLAMRFQAARQKKENGAGHFGIALQPTIELVASVRFSKSMDALIMCKCAHCRPRPTLDEIRRQEADILRYEQAQARDEARRNATPRPALAKPEIRGCVFAKSSGLPNGMINHSSPSGFIPVELLTQYGAFAVLGSGSTSASLAWIGGASSATALTGRLGGTLTAEPANLDILALVLVSDLTATDCALYTLDQYTTLTTAKTRVRLQVERLAGDSVRAYGFYTGKNKEWENVPVIAATAEGERFVVELGQGVRLTWTPGTAAPMPVLKDAPPLPPVWVYPPTEKAEKILGKPVLLPEYQDMVIWFPNTEIPPFYLSFCIAQPCPHPDMMEELAAYIAGEMNRNIKDPAVLEMRRLIDYDPVAEEEEFARLPALARVDGPPNYRTTAMAKKVEAAMIWTKKVGQNQPWDHKPKLRVLYNNDVWHKQGKYAYFYDIWSNIHYGYVGIIAGISESVLLDGAGAEQIVSDTYRKVDEWYNKPKKDWELPGPHTTASPWTSLRSWDDVADRVSISIGMRLADQHPSGGVTAQMIMAEVLAVEPKDWGDGIEVHKCK